MQPTQELIDDLFRERVLRARRTPPGEKLLDGFRLFEMALVFTRAGIRAENPGADDNRIEELLAKRIALLNRLEEIR